MRRTLAPVLALGLTAALGIAAAPSVEEVPYIATDPAGDGNALNGQGAADAGSTVTGPAQLAEGDILGARITSQFRGVTGADGLVDNVLTGLEFRTALSGEPTATSVPLVHRFIGSAGGCTFWVQAETGTNGADPHGTASVRLFDTGCGLEPTDDPLGNSETVTGDWLSYGWDAETGEMVVTLDLAAADADQRLASRIARDDFYVLEELHNRANTGVVTAPVFDEMPEGGFAVIGADIPADQVEGEPTPACDRSTRGFQHEVFDFDFSPADRDDLCIGDTITFTNTGVRPHTASSLDEHFDTGTIDAGTTATITLEQGGTFDYQCNIHPSMTGTFTIAG